MTDQKRELGTIKSMVTYCYKRWFKAQGTKYELFWLNMFAKFDDKA